MLCGVLVDVHRTLPSLPLPLIIGRAHAALFFARATRLRVIQELFRSGEPARFMTVLHGFLLRGGRSLRPNLFGLGGGSLLLVDLWTRAVLTRSPTRCHIVHDE